eukprot:TRINITY_DN56912_c0_g1_i1.p1 TRINITY_DN56912_c0_g1~~TRINITY_DN56912_c0_g1_i1.p1  ORF type:complete len:646 (+),score=74.70 TRINITY_DN56912_c0_g1_i1:39-1940(+)
MPRPDKTSLADSPMQIKFAAVEETSSAFEESIKALSCAFHSLQQQHYETLRATYGDQQATGENMQFSNQAVENSPGTEGPDGDQLAKGNPTPVLNKWSSSCSSQFPLGADQGTRQLHHQFLRLDMNGSGFVDAEDPVSHMSSFGEGMELQNLPLLIEKVNSLCGGSNPQELDFRGFATLMLDDSLLQDQDHAQSSIQRDTKNLRKCLELENNNHLYADDGHLTGAGTFFRGGPSARMALVYEISMSIVIGANAVAMGLSADFAADDLFWDMLDGVFCFCYVLEAISKLCFYGFGWYFLGPESLWNTFDLFCMLLSVVDSSITFAMVVSTPDADSPLGALTLIRILRLARLTRLIRALRFRIFKELRLMVGGVLSGIKVLGWAMVLLLLLVYIFAVAFRHTLDEPEFRDIQSSMFSLFRCFTEGCAAYDGTPLTERLRIKYGALFLIAYIFMWAGICLGVFNLIVAIFIDDVSNTQVDRKLQEMAKNVHNVEVNIKENLVRLILQSRATGVAPEIEEEIVSMEHSFTSRAARIRAQFQCLEDSRIVIARSAFETYMSDAQFANVLQHSEIETTYGSIYDFLDADMGGWLSVHEVYEGLMSLRGPVNKAEVVGLRLKIRHIVKMLHAYGMSEFRP